MSCTFTSGATEVSVKDPLAPYGPEEAPRQARTVSGGGVIRVSTLGDPDQVLPLHFVRVSNSQWVALKTFIEDTISHGATAFTFTDPLGTAYTNMRYMGGKETARRQAKGGTWSFDITLQKDLGA